MTRAIVDACKTAPLSNWSIGMHIEHCGLTMLGICDQLSRSQPPRPGGFNMVRTLMLFTGWIPRGRAKAPQPVLPQPQPPVEALHQLIEQSRQALARTEPLADEKWFAHPMLGPMSKRQTLRFIAVHNHHHLKIIRDIQSAR